MLAHAAHGLGMIVEVLLRLTEVQTADCSCCRVATGSAADQTAHTHMHKRTTQQILGNSFWATLHLLFIFLTAKGNHLYTFEL